MLRLIRYPLTMSGLLLILLSSLLLYSRRYPSNAYWLLMSVDEGSQQQLVKMSPGGGRWFPITPKWRAFLELEQLADDEWVYLAHYPGQYDADGRERAELIRVNRADLHYESFGWLSVNETLTPMPDGDWLVTNVAFSTTGFYRLRRDGQGRKLIFRFDEPTMNIVTNPTILFSPDGQWMYFNVADASTTQLDVYRVRLDGTGLMNLTPTRHQNLALVKLQTGEDWLVVSGLGVRDGKPATDIYWLSSDGASFVPVVEGVPINLIEVIAWLPQDRLFILRGQSHRLLIATQFDNPTPLWQIDEPAYYVRPLPSGDLVMTNDVGIYRIALDGTRRLVSPLLPLLYMILPQPDPEHWLYFKYNATPVSTLRRVNLVTGRQYIIVATSGPLDFGAFSPDESWLIFDGIVNSKPGLYRVNVDGSGLYRIADKDADLAFVDFGPRMDLDWSAGLLLAGGGMLCVIGIPPHRKFIRPRTQRNPTHNRWRRQTGHNHPASN